VVFDQSQVFPRYVVYFDKNSKIDLPPLSETKSGYIFFNDLILISLKENLLVNGMLMMFVLGLRHLILKMITLIFSKIIILMEKY